MDSDQGKKLQHQWRLYKEVTKQLLEGDQDTKSITLTNRMIKFSLYNIQCDVKESLYKRKDVTINNQFIQDQIILYGVDWFGKKRIEQYFQNFNILQMKWLNDSHCKLKFKDHDEASLAIKAKLKNKNKPNIESVPLQYAVWYELQPYYEMRVQKKLQARFAIKGDVIQNQLNMNKNIEQKAKQVYVHNQIAKKQKKIKKYEKDKTPYPKKFKQKFTKIFKQQKKNQHLAQQNPISSFQNHSKITLFTKPSNVNKLVNESKSKLSTQMIIENQIEDQQIRKTRYNQGRFNNNYAEIAMTDINYGLQMEKQDFDKKRKHRQQIIQDLLEESFYKKFHRRDNPTIGIPDKNFDYKSYLQSEKKKSAKKITMIVLE